MVAALSLGSSDATAQRCAGRWTTLASRVGSGICQREPAPHSAEGGRRPFSLHVSRQPARLLYVERVAYPRRFPTQHGKRDETSVT